MAPRRQADLLQRLRPEAPPVPARSEPPSADHLNVRQRCWHRRSIHEGIVHSSMSASIRDCDIAHAADCSGCRQLFSRPMTPVRLGQCDGKTFSVCALWCCHVLLSLLTCSALSMTDSVPLYRRKTHCLRSCLSRFNEVVQRQLVDLGSHDEVIPGNAITRVRPQLQRKLVPALHRN